MQVFRTWRNNVRYKLYCGQRRRLAQKLFLAKPTFCNPLLQVNACLNGLKDIHLIDMSGTKARARGGRVWE